MRGRANHRFTDAVPGKAVFVGRASIVVGTTHAIVGLHPIAATGGGDAGAYQATVV